MFMRFVKYLEKTFVVGWLTTSTLIGGGCGSHLYHTFGYFSNPGEGNQRCHIRLGISREQEQMKYAQISEKRAESSGFLEMVEHHRRIVNQCRESIYLLKKELKSTPRTGIEKYTLLPEEFFWGGLVGLIAGIGIICSSNPYSNYKGDDDFYDNTINE